MKIIVKHRVPRNEFAVQEFSDDMTHVVDDDYVVTTERGEIDEANSKVITFTDGSVDRIDDIVNGTHFASLTRN